MNAAYKKQSVNHVKIIYQKLVNILIILTVLFTIVSCDSKDFSKKEHVRQFLTERFFESSKDDKFLPDFEYELISGKKEKMKNNRGKVILLNFWSTWCFPCKKEMPDMEELKHLMKGENFRILAVNSGEKKNKVKRFLSKFPYSFDIVTDEDRLITTTIGITGLPTTFIISGDGKVLGKIMGPVDWKEPSFVDFLKKISQI